MKVDTPFTDWLAEELKVRAWSISELARRSEVSRSLISGVMNGLEPSWEFCAAIAPALNMSPIEVFLRAGKLTIADVRRTLPSLPEQEIGTTQQLIAVIQELSEEDQKALLRLTRGLLPTDEAEKIASHDSLAHGGEDPSA
jgi:transcriptional regulator with XRE-family HTH domain